MGNVRPLCHEEGVRVDAARLAALVAELGERGAEDAVTRTMEEMSLRLAHMEHQYMQGGTDVICRDARHLAGLAGEVGMTSFARVAEDVRICSARGDMVAFAATWARLVRTGDRSLTAIWEMAEMPG